MRVEHKSGKVYRVPEQVDMTDGLLIERCFIRMGLAESDPQFYFFQAEDGIRDLTVTGVQTCALPIYRLVANRWPSSEHARVQQDGHRSVSSRSAVWTRWVGTACGGVRSVRRSCDEAC